MVTSIRATDTETSTCPPVLQLYTTVLGNTLNDVTTLAVELDRTLQSLDSATASRLERLVRDAIELVRPSAPGGVDPGSGDREQWVRRLDQLRDSIGTGKPGPTTEQILDELRAEGRE